ncbi:insulinase family protein [Flavobacteriaceae bacterium F08102]|nr:insulinase family protein [Flavobacteriaceae bacterium F08102]
MKKIIYTICLLISFSNFAQSLDLDQKLPVNTKVRKGVLANGMTYYIYNTDVTKGVASYYIIQNVGSILENDHQQGLAHFLEHMAFNGTKHFEGKGILQTLEKVGAVFGRNINAYTSFDETVYNMDNIPTDNGMIDTCLTILQDWSNYLLLTDDEIDAERGVIKEEWRTRQNGRMRILAQTLPTMFNNSKYAERLPIGKMDIVENFEYKALRDFYHDWYRTDLQAIAVVGDIDVNEIEQKIKDKFSKIPAVKNPKERYNVAIPGNKEMLYKLAMDEEISTASILMSINHTKSLADKTVGDLRTSLLNGMVTGMISSRLKERSQNPDATFLGAGVSYRNKSRLNDELAISVSPKPGKQAAAFKEVMTEVSRAVNLGFTKGELDRFIKQYTNYYETQVSKVEDLPHGQIINMFKADYLNNDTMTDIAEEFELVKKIFASLTVADLNSTIKKLYTKENRAVIVTGVKGKDNLTEAQAKKILNEVENDTTLTPYTDEFSGKTLLSGLNVKAGHIVSETIDENIGATTFELSNGVKVHYKFADKNKNDVQLYATSKGGSSLIDDADLPSASMLGNIVQMSGLGDYSATELPKVLAGKTATTKISLSGLSETVSGASVTKDTETMMQMVYLRFVKPRFDEQAYKVLQGNIKNFLLQRSNDIGAKMQDSMTVALYGKNDPKNRIMDQALFDEVSFEKMKEIYHTRFNDPADFEFFIVGDITKEQLKPLLNKYIASIPTKGIKEEWKDNSSSWLSDVIDKDIYLKMEDPKSSVRIEYKNEMPYSLKNSMMARTLGDILQLRYTATLREEEGGTYGASVQGRFSKRPVEVASLFVGFDCNPDKVDDLVKIVHNEIQKIANGEINQEDLDKTLANYIKVRKEQKDYNSYDMSLLRNYFLEGYNMEDPKSFDKIVNSITAKDIKKYTKRLLKNAKTYEIVFKPAE